MGWQGPGPWISGWEGAAGTGGHTRAEARSASSETCVIWIRRFVRLGPARDDGAVSRDVCLSPVGTLCTEGQDCFRLRVTRQRGREEAGAEAGLAFCSRRPGNGPERPTPGDWSGMDGRAGGEGPSLGTWPPLRRRKGCAVSRAKAISAGVLVYTHPRSGSRPR